MSTPEGNVLNAVCEYLHLRGYFFFRLNNVGVFDPVKKVHRSLPKWSIRGVPDLLIVWKGQVFFIEVKAPKGIQSPEQKAFEAMIEENDCDYHLVRSVDDIANLFPKRA